LDLGPSMTCGVGILGVLGMWLSHMELVPSGAQGVGISAEQGPTGPKGQGSPWGEFAAVSRGAGVQQGLRGKNSGRAYIQSSHVELGSSRT
jgi:hypothetical protein